VALDPVEEARAVQYRADLAQTQRAISARLQASQGGWAVWRAEFARWQPLLPDEHKAPDLYVLYPEQQGNAEGDYDDAPSP